MIDLKFIALTYLFGPIISVPYALSILHLSTLKIYIYLSLLYILILPLVFHFYEFMGNKKLYESSIIKKVCKACDIKAKDEIEKIKGTGDSLIENFERHMGHLGFYLAITVFTLLFGIFWAALLAYLLKVERIKALWSITAGILIGNVFWVLVISTSLPRFESQIFLIFLVFTLIIYGRHREMRILRKIYAAIR